MKYLIWHSMVDDLENMIQYYIDKLYWKFLHKYSSILLRKYLVVKMIWSNVKV